MAIKKRIVRGGKGAGNTAPSASTEKSSSGGGIKKRSSLPPPDNTDDLNTLPGELGSTIGALIKNGHYGTPFLRASSPRMRRARLRTGILSLDLCLGGGWTRSAAGMIYGEKSSGKTTTVLQSIAELHRTDPEAYAAWLDIEGTLDYAWARKIGVDLDRLVVVEPETGEHAVDLADHMLRSREVQIVVADSIAMLVPMKEIDESAEQETMALQARLVGKYIRKTNNAILKERQREHQPVLIHINQFRMKVGLVFGDPRVLPGGKALEFSTTQQVEIKNKEHLGKDDDGDQNVLYNEHNAKITKNKGGGIMKEAAFKLIRTAGYEQLPEAWVDQAKTVRLFATKAGLCDGSPNSYTFDDIDYRFKSAADFNNWALENPRLGS
jgi:recombination protein RecA